jgi:alpha-amylase
MALNGQNSAGRYDADSFVYGFNNVVTGNHVATVVTFEPTFDGTHGYSIKRVPGMFTATGVGLGFGDLNANGTYQVNDIQGLGGAFEQILYSQNMQFRAVADLDGNGLVDNRDLFLLGPHLQANGASASVMAAYDGVLLRRGDINEDGTTNVQDVAALYAAFGESTWRSDLNVDGIVDVNDVQTLITEITRTVNGDFNLDGKVDGRDFLIWQRNVNMESGVRYDLGDADLNGVIDGADLAIWQAAYGSVANLAALSTRAAETLAIPEPMGIRMVCWAAACFGLRRNKMWRF